MMQGQVFNYPLIGNMVVGSRKFDELLDSMYGGEKNFYKVFMKQYIDMYRDSIRRAAKFGELTAKEAAEERRNLREFEALDVENQCLLVLCD